MYLQGNLSIEVAAGDQAGSLVANVRVMDNAGDVLDEATGIPLMPGSTLSYGPVGLEVHLDSVLNQGGSHARPTSPATPGHPQQPGRPQAPKK